MRIRKFTDNKLNENATGDATLYRLVSVPEGDHLVINTKEPGKYYFQTEKDIDPKVLKDNSGEMHVIKVQTPNSNINKEESETETEAHGGGKIVVLNDPSDAKIQSIEPYKKAA